MASSQAAIRPSCNRKSKNIWQCNNSDRQNDVFRMKLQYARIKFSRSMLSNLFRKTPFSMKKCNFCGVVEHFPSFGQVRLLSSFLSCNDTDDIVSTPVDKWSPSSDVYSIKGLLHQRRLQQKLFLSQNLSKLKSPPAEQYCPVATTPHVAALHREHTVCRMHSTGRTSEFEKVTCARCSTHAILQYASYSKALRGPSFLRPSLNTARMNLQ